MDYSALQKISYGLYIVAAEHNGEKDGFIANTVFQVTSSPATIAVSCNKNNHSLKFILGSRALSVSVLEKETPVSLITTFGYQSGTGLDKFTGIAIVRKKTGAPVVTNHTIAWLDCTVKETVDLGTHVLIICNVEESGLLSGEMPLTYSYYREKYKSSSPRNAPTYIEKEQLPENKPVASDTQAEESEAVLSYDDEPYICPVCGFIYRPEEGDPSAGIAPGTSFSDVPDDYRCPICNAEKEIFRPFS